MLRLALSLLVVALLAACSGAPQKTARAGGSYASSGGAYRTPPPGFPHFVDHSTGREEISIQAMSLVGVPYRWGGNTPDAGFDCSGLVHYVVQRAASVNLPRTTVDMSSRGESVEPEEIAPGDLIFFNTTGRPHSHVGIYVGKLRFVNAPSTGGTVRLDYLTNPYWAKRFDGIRRVAAPLGQPTPFDAPTYQASAPVAPTVAAFAAPKPAPAPAATPASASADAFEPPPPGMSAAQTQARAAGAVAPTVSGSPDALDAAADAYEPPPPAAVAARQARQAVQARDQAPAGSGGVQIMRASTASRPLPAPTQTNDDPIAGFANSN